MISLSEARTTPVTKYLWLRIMLMIVGAVGLALLLATAVLLPGERRWSHEREQFARQHYASHYSFGLDHLVNRPFGSPPMRRVILNHDATAADLARARSLFPETKYIGQFTTDRAERNSNEGKAFAPEEVEWFGNHPHRAQ